MKRISHALEQKSINEAVLGNWAKAATLNEKIVKDSKNNIDAYLRLGFANLQLGSITKAKKSYLKALKLHPASQIAISNLEKIRILEKKGDKFKSTGTKSPSVDPNLFLNIVGKTKVIALINIGQANLLVKLKVGQMLVLKIKKRRVEIRTETNEYIGALPDDISKRMIFFIEAGSEYEAFIKETSKNSVDIFIREVKKGRKVAHYTSFPKNIQDDIRLFMQDEEDRHHTEDETEEEGEDGESPVDLERLADQVVETEFYPEEAGQTAEDESDES